MSYYDRTTTLAEAKKVVRDGLKSGITCPCCGRLCKLYPRKLHKEMATFLIQLVRAAEHDDGWIHIRNLLPASPKASTDGSYLTHWGLLETKPSDPGEKSDGFYRPTDKGKRFVQGKVRVPSHAYIFSGRCYHFSDEQVSITEALGQPFNYREMMDDRS